MHAPLAPATPHYSTWTETEIRQQPDCWMNALHSIDSQRTALDAFLAPLLAQDNLNIILTGAGTSAFIGEMISPVLRRLTGRSVTAIPTTDIVTNPVDYLPQHRPVLLISFARSGNSPESVAAFDLANQCIADCSHLVITCNKEGHLYQRVQGKKKGFALLMPPQTNDKAFAMTSSITSMMCSCLAALAPQTFSTQHFTRVAQRARETIAAHGNGTQHLPGNDHFSRVVYLGSGSFQGLARESALKLLELTAGQTAAFYDTPTGFRHGPKSLVNEETLVVMYISNQPYTRQYDLDLLAELRRDRIAKCVIAIADKPDDIISAGTHCYLPAGEALSDTELLFCFLPYAQLFALSQSVKAGITPDTPSASGTVNRVVQGVIIHPWTDQHTGA
ncbi:SIS domain-containing protein [Morganella psychrotolerans]|uniref:SIS domain-containing protein n=1 Tax=Morganella psychrotolerans TaxID=368603 RepID=UPI0039B068BD